MCAEWKKSQGTWDEYSGAACHCREKILVAKAQLELKLARAVGDNKKNFLKYINGNRQITGLVTG